MYFYVNLKEDGGYGEMSVNIQSCIVKYFLYHFNLSVLRVHKDIRKYFADIYTVRRLRIVKKESLTFFLCLNSYTWHSIMVLWRDKPREVWASEVIWDRASSSSGFNLSAHPFPQQRGCKALHCSENEDHCLFIRTLKEPLINTHTQNSDMYLHQTRLFKHNGCSASAVGTG